MLSNIVSIKMVRSLLKAFYDNNQSFEVTGNDQVERTAERYIRSTVILRPKQKNENVKRDLTVSSAFTKVQQPIFSGDRRVGGEIFVCVESAQNILGLDANMPAGHSPNIALNSSVNFCSHKQV